LVDLPETDPLVAKLSSHLACVSGFVKMKFRYATPASVLLMPNIGLDDTDLRLFHETTSSKRHCSGDARFRKPYMCQIITQEA
jgi:hypothetical protein